MLVLCWVCGWYDSTVHLQSGYTNLSRSSTYSSRLQHITNTVVHYSTPANQRDAGMSLPLLVLPGQMNLLTIHLLHAYGSIHRVDFGTSCSGFSYAIRGEGGGNYTTRVHTAWPQQALPYPKTRTTLLYDLTKLDEPLSWGWPAFNEYLVLAPREERDRRYAGERVCMGRHCCKTTGIHIEQHDNSLHNNSKAKVHPRQAIKMPVSKMLVVLIMLILKHMTAGWTVVRA